MFTRSKNNHLKERFATFRHPSSPVPRVQFPQDLQGSAPRKAREEEDRKVPHPKKFGELKSGGFYISGCHHQFSQKKILNGSKLNYHPIKKKNNSFLFGFQNEFLGSAISWLFTWVLHLFFVRQVAFCASPADRGDMTQLTAGVTDDRYHVCHQSIFGSNNAPEWIPDPYFKKSSIRSIWSITNHQRNPPCYWCFWNPLVFPSAVFFFRPSSINILKNGGFSPANHRIWRASFKGCVLLI